MIFPLTFVESTCNVLGRSFVSAFEPSSAKVPDYISGEEYDHRTNYEVAYDVVTAAAADVICI